MPVSPAAARALLATSGVVLVAGAALAVTKPGNLGDEDTADTAAEATTTTATTATTVLGGPSETTLTLPGEGTAAGDTTATTSPGSGLGTGGPSVADGATATTGIELDALLGPGSALLAAAGLARAAARRRPA